MPRTDSQLAKLSACTPSRYRRRHVGLATGTRWAFDRASPEAVRADETLRLNTVNAYLVSRYSFKYTKGVQALLLRCGDIHKNPGLLSVTQCQWNKIDSL
ncbi:unnamed protein product [Phytomonas sp. EM1]|nr:unnamed protein product [Phytomonas sp. EM1]|eukprot:CCW64163.1 unnamed protein product [Phytomonas sp. isolate EM1]